MSNQKKQEKPKQTKKSTTQSKINRLENGNIEIEITIPWDIVSEQYDKTLQKLAKKTEIKGFRPGKAPLKKIEEKIGKQKIYQEMLKNFLTDVYIEAFKTHKLVPIVNPKIQLISAEENKNWQVKVTTAELPKIKLGDYQEKIRKAFAGEKIWVPGKKDNGKQMKKEQEKLQKIFQTLIDEIKIKLPQLLLENEVTRRLSQLVDQTSKLGLTVEQYLTSVGKTTEKIKEEYKKEAEKSIKIELLLSAIADKENIKVTDKEVNQMITKTPDKKSQEQLATPQQKSYIKQVLRKRKVIDRLLKL